MICLICRQADVVDGFRSIPFEREEFRLMIRGVPAQICPHCGESYVSEDVALRLLDQADTISMQGIFEDVCEYAK